ALRSHNASMLNSTYIPNILIWTPSISIRNVSDDSLIQILRNLGQSCPFKCEIEGRKRIHENDASAIVFHSRTMVSTDLPNHRTEDQIYVFLCREAQNRCGEEDKKTVEYKKEMYNLQLIPTFFNTSMTNLRDEIAYNLGYGEVVRTNNDDLLKKISNEMWFRIFSKKKKLGLAIISNCYTPSKREYYLKVGTFFEKVSSLLQELSLHVKLSLLGSCFGSHRVCSNTEQKQHCMDELLGWNAELRQSHFFYFAFENSVCKDYITEKLFDRLQKNIVPVVLRRRILEGVIPSSAFIAADDFASPKHLAEYLIRVSNDEKLYRSYFEWRNTHAVLPFITMRGNGICALCSDLWRKVTSCNYFN
ncbi:hypothetical protein PRIPAC_92734, partial [Pristionchus pacificus]|uniref:Fucosyltransferase n=1 Tax=Pristionchus pacificus TaxID=54126 RepID=A0A2A6BRM9_PRIPA